MPVRIRCHSRVYQQGAALLLLVVTLVLGAAAVFYGLSTTSGSTIEKEKVTAAALEQAKTALIGYAVGANLGANERPGDLPCPDINDNGAAGTNCNLQPLRVGRLPWKTLGLPDLRDGDGERLWYAVSNNFKKAPRTPCLASGDPGCLNSDTRGTITVRDSSGNVVNDGVNPDPFTPSGVIAVIFAPGAVLTRQGAANVQDRSCTVGTNCTTAGVCTSSPETDTPKCNPINYLDIVIGIEDNADFIDGSNTNGFINGMVRANGNVIANDRLMVLTYKDLMPALEKRVAMETLNCLRSYATFAPFGSHLRYPWASPSTSASTNDVTDTLFGRLPGSPPYPLGYLANTFASSANTMPTTWPAACTLTYALGAWWHNWREHVFYAVADAYKPGSTLPIGCGAPGSCLSVNPPSATENKEVVVVVSGKRLSGIAGGQPRGIADKQNPANYFEGNYTPPVFTKQPGNTTFNDTVVFYPP